MATKVKPCRIKATGTPQVWYVPKYVDEDTFQWWAWWGGWWSDIEYVTKAEYNALLPWALTDWKHYFIYSTDGGWGWQPWVNTMAYYKFDWNLNDSSGNGYDLSLLYGSDVMTYPTLTWTEKYGARGSWNMCSWTTLSSLDLWTWTASGYFKISANTNNVIWYMWWRNSTWRSWKWTWMIINQSWEIVIFVFGGDIYTWVTVTAGDWHNIVFTQWNWETKIYVDWQLENTLTKSYSKTDNILRFFGDPYSWANSAPMDYDEFILENKTRTAQEISDYFDQTKWNYWIS